MREPKVKDIRALSTIKDDAEKEFNLISNLTGLTPGELDELSFKDYKILQDKLNSFLL
jgi:hypothetical protein